MINDLSGVFFYLCFVYAFLLNDTSKNFLWSDILNSLMTTKHKIDLYTEGRLVNLLERETISEGTKTLMK